MGLVRRCRSGGRVLVLAAAYSSAACIPSRWVARGDAADVTVDGAASDALVELDATNDTASDVVADLPASDPPMDGAISPDDAPSILDVPPLVDLADIPEDALDAGPDAPEAAVSAYRLDTEDTIFAPRIGTAVVPAVSPGNRREFDCAPTGPSMGVDILSGFVAEAPVDVSSQSYINHLRFLCGRLAPSGVVGPPERLMDRDFNSSPRSPGEVTGLQRCPAGFVFVGLQGEDTYSPSVATYFATRMGLVCVRIEAWRTNPSSLPRATDPLFETSRPPSGPDGGSDSDASADGFESADAVAEPDVMSADAQALFGSDTLPPLVPCASVPASAQACARPIYGGRPTGADYDTAGHPQRPYFVACPGGYAPVGLRGSGGFFVDALDLRCARIVRDP